MADKQKIKITIADRVYPLTVLPSQEEGLRKASKKIEDMIKQFEESYAVQDKQDVLAMCALQFASKLEQTKGFVEQEQSTSLIKLEDLNLQYIHHLKENYPTAEIGYSGHEYGLVTTYAAVGMGASWVERHITLDRNNWGSDQLSSIEPDGLIKLVKGVRSIEKAMKYEPGPRLLFEGEKSKKNSLRK